MNREIKFRAWRKNKMLGPFTLEDMLNSAAEMGFHLNAPSPVVWMQYTGMKYLNWDDVYEMDIVKGIASAPDGPEKVEFIGVVKWDIEDAGFYFEAGGNWPCIKPWFVKSFEKIGTVHENPELIEGKE